MSRIQAAKERAVIVKRGLVFVAAAAMLVAGVLARATNPGHAATRSSRSSPSTASSSDSQSQSSDDFSIAPSTSQPQVRTGVS